VNSIETTTEAGLPEEDNEVLATMEIETSEQVTVYDSGSEIRQPVTLFKNIYADFLAGRELAWRLFLRNLRGMYRQTALGLFWAFLPPVANTAIWIFLRQVGVFKLGGDMDVPGTVYILTGMIFWQTFVEAFQMPMKVVTQNRSMISKLRFPREALLTVGLGEILFDLAIRCLLLIPAFLLYQFMPPGPMILLAIPLAILMILFASGLGMLLMPIGSLYQDVGRFIALVMPFWMILTPIIHVAQPGFWGNLKVWLNPAAPLIVLARDLTLLNQSAFWLPGMVVAAVAIPLFLFGLAVFRISIPVIVERMQAF